MPPIYNSDRSIRLDIDALRSFLAFSETGSFTRAAKKIHRTQSAFSAQMRKLELEAGVALFEKDGRNLVLTEAGISLRASAEKLISMHDNALTQVQRYQGKSALRLGCPEDYNTTILPKIIARLKEASPTCSIQVFNEPSISLRKGLDSGELDAAIITRAPDSEEGHWLAHDKGIWIAAKDFKQEPSDDLPLALFQADCKYHAAAIDGLSKQGIGYQLLACCNTSSALKAIVRQGLAIGAIGGLSVGDEFTILEDMPALPNVDIVLALGVKHHPLLDASFIQGLSKGISID